MSEWRNIHFAWHEDKEDALEEMRVHQKAMDKPKGKYEFRVVKHFGRNRPFAKKKSGWQVQFRPNPKLISETIQDEEENEELEGKL